MTHLMPNYDLTTVRKMGRGNQTKAVNLKTEKYKGQKKRTKRK